MAYQNNKKTGLRYPAIYDMIAKAENKYALVLATSKRAREIVDGKDPLVKIDVNNAVSIATKEIHEDVVRIVSENAPQAPTEEVFPEEAIDDVPTTAELAEDAIDAAAVTADSEAETFDPEGEAEDCPEESQDAEPSIDAPADEDSNTDDVITLDLD